MQVKELIKKIFNSGGIERCVQIVFIAPFMRMVCDA